MSLSFCDPRSSRQVLRRGVQGQGHDLLRPAVRHGGVHQQHHRRDQEPDRVHGRLPADDRQGHLRHQRHRAGRGLPARPLARASTSTATSTRPPTRTSTRLQGHPVPGRLAGVRGRQARHRRRPHRPQAPAARHRAAQGARLEQRTRSSSASATTSRCGHPGEGPHRRPGRRAARHLPQAAPGRAADPGVGADAAGQPVLQPQALRPGQGRPLQGQQEARSRAADINQGTSPRTTSSPRSSTSSGCTPASERRNGESWSRPTTSTTSATAGCARSAS